MNKLTSLVAAATVASLAGASQAAILSYYNFGNAIAANATVSAPYGATTVASGVSVSNMQFESGWLVITDQVDVQLNSASLTIGSQTFNSDSTGTYAAIVDDKFTRANFQVSNEGDSRNGTDPGKGMLQLLTPGNNISDVAESRSKNLGFGLTVTASGSTLDLSSLVLQAARYNLNPERSFQTVALYADTGGGQFLVGTSSATPLSGTLAPVTFDLTSLSDIANGNSVTFRMYGDNGTSGDSSFGREFWIDDITLNGTVTLVPEPTAIASVAVLALLGGRRRRVG